MKRFFIYTKLQTKKIMRTYPAMLLMTCLLALVLLAMLYMQTSRASDTMTGDEDAKAAIGIIGADSSPYLKMGISMLQNMDPSNIVVRFEELGREDAMQQLKDGKLAAAIDIPADMTDKLLSGDLTSQMTLMIPDTSASLGPLLIRELSACISCMISKIESASFALSDFYQESGITNIQDINDAQTDLLYSTLKKILNRGNMFTLRRMKTKATVTIESYYLCAMFLLLILLTGVMCAGNYINADHPVGILLRIRGFSAVLQILAEFLSLILFMLFLGIVFIPISGLALSHMPVVFSELRSGTPLFFGNFVLFAVRALPVVLMTASLDLLLYEIADSLISGVLLQFLVTIALAWLSGIFYPVSSLPEAIRTLFPFLPTGQAMLYLRQSMIKGNSFILPLICVSVYTAVFLVLTCILRRKNLVKAG